jgi:hypothetical protein
MKSTRLKAGVLTLHIEIKRTWWINFYESAFLSRVLPELLACQSVGYKATSIENIKKPLGG